MILILSEREFNNDSDYVVINAIYKSDVVIVVKRGDIFEIKKNKFGRCMESTSLDALLLTIKNGGAN